MKRRSIAVAWCVIGLGVPAGVAAARQSSTVRMTARLTAGQAARQSVKVTAASGRFTGSLRRYGDGHSRLGWTLTYHRMSSRVTKAELVVPAKGRQGAVAIQLCASCRAREHGVISPIFKVSTTALVTRPAWVIVYTRKNRKGEIRGRILRSP